MEAGKTQAEVLEARVLKLELALSFLINSMRQANGNNAFLEVAEKILSTGDSN